MNGVQQEDEKIAMVTKGEDEEIKVGDKQAEEIQVEENGENNEEENKAEEEKNEKGEKTKEEADKQGDKGEVDKEVEDRRNPTRLQEDETEIDDMNPANPNQAKWGYSDQEIRELEGDEIFDQKINYLILLF